MLLTIALLAQNEAAQKLADPVHKAADWRAYSYNLTLGSIISEGVWEKEGKSSRKSGGVEEITINGKTVVKNSDGTWTSSASATTPAPKKGKKAKKAAKSTAKSTDTRLPVEYLAGLDQKFFAVTSSADGDNTVYSGELTSEATAALFTAPKKKKAAAAAPVDTRANAKVTVDKDGNIARVEISIGGAETQVNPKGKATKGKAAAQPKKILITFADINKATVSIPDEARKALP